MIQFLGIVTHILCLVNGYLLHLIFETFLPLKKSKTIKIAVIFCCFALASIRIWVDDIINFWGALLIISTIILVFYKGSLAIKISMVLIFFSMIIAVNFITNNIAENIIFSYYEPKNETINTVFSNLIININIALRIPVWYYTLRLCKKHIKGTIEMMNKRMWILIGCICISVFTVNFAILNYLPDKIIYTYPICITTIITILGCLNLTGYIAKSIQITLKLNALELEQRYYQDKFTDEQRVRSIYHDMKNHLLLLKSSVRDNEETNKMIESIKEQIEDYENYHHTGNDYLDVILKDKCILAKNNGIDIHVAIDFEAGGFIEPLDISTLFGNALDNAIEASLKLPLEERLITIKAARLHDMIVINIENNISIDDKLNKRTSKHDKFLHGFGIENIQKTVHKYQGECVIKKDENRFVLKIVITIPQNRYQEVS